MRGRSDGGVVLGSMHVVEYDDAHFVGGILSGSCSAEIVPFRECGGRVQVVVSADVHQYRSCCGMCGR